MQLNLSYSDVIAALLNLVFDIAKPLFPQVVEHFRENKLQGIVACLVYGRKVGVLYGVVLVVTNVKSGSMAVAAVF